MKQMFNKQFLSAAVATILAFAILSPTVAQAGLAEAKAAYDAKDYKTAFKEYLPLAEAGNAEAQYRIGDMYRYGDGINQNYDTAMSWFKKAVRNGYRPMMLTLGYMVGKGQGIKASLDGEICFYRLEAVRGNPQTQWALYLALRKKYFVSKKRKQWLKRAVKQGEPAAMARYGALIIFNPLEFDKVKGYMYLWLGHINGNNSDVLAYINEQTENNPTQQKKLAEGKKRTAKWKPVKEIPPPTCRLSIFRSVWISIFVYFIVPDPPYLPITV